MPNTTHRSIGDRTACRFRSMTAACKPTMRKVRTRQQASTLLVNYFTWRALIAPAPPSSSLNLAPIPDKLSESHLVGAHRPYAVSRDDATNPSRLVKSLQGPGLWRGARRGCQQLLGDFGRQVLSGHAPLRPPATGECSIARARHFLPPCPPPKHSTKHPDAPHPLCRVLTV
jgi:hypothetical protein